ncbi:LLM class flavin-dependent oxidoreductase [Aeromicrobium sp. UC242_57]|uniref:LLM class flavin-dependent oxidoreductase n=1 Tax=Aeromicrobium sp. UC242_57 TaxID=3374624 RepID=UPI0037A28C75
MAGSATLCSPRFLADRVLGELQAGVAKVDGKTMADVDVVVSACCGVHDDLSTARRYVAGTVGFYASVRTYADFFEFHGLGEEQQRVIDAFRDGRGADYLASEVSDQMVDALTMAGTRDQVAERIAAYEGLADAVKLSAPVHGMTPAEIRAAQDELISMIEVLAR